ncbi:MULTISPECIES: RNase H family protein [Actinomycetaceae]|uniref:RNase H family protein n=1 Tax=Actinomycetaceae TaxID=2049 RepID=UPI000397CEF4|nr:MULTISPECIES: RNase H family protein [Actinomycetaceae]ERH26656.1 ribonuclease HI [Actinomyces sp. oral taxon 172 str. F0311]WLD78145.1 ribonuclease HI [Schaalia sp. HMT-172]
MTITAAADGSSLGNPGPAGWAWYVDEDTWDAGGWPKGTNNLGELTAILRLLQATAETGDELHILADSQYAINVVSKWRLGWKKRGWTKADKKPIKNLELIQEIDRAMEGRRVTFEWVKGHAGHRMNERADDLARGCAEAYQAGRTPEPGPGFGGGSSRTTASTTQADDGAASAGSADTHTASTSETPHDATSADAPATASSSRGGSAEDTAPTSAEPQGVATSDSPATESPSRGASAKNADPAGTGSADTIDTPTTGTASSSGATTSTFRSHPSVFSASTESSVPTEAAPASSESEPSATTEDAIAREREFILAWTGGDEEALAAMTDERTTRIWPGGAATTTLAGPSPASPAVGRIDAHDLGGAFLTRYRVRWEGGASLESSVWAPATSGEARLVMVHHQSTLIS